MNVIPVFIPVVYWESVVEVNENTRSRLGINDIFLSPNDHVQNICFQASSQTSGYFEGYLRVFYQKLESAKLSRKLMNI